MLMKVKRYHSQRTALNKTHITTSILLCHHFSLGTSLWTLLSRHRTTLWTHPSLLVLPLPHTSSLRSEMPVVVSLALLGRQPRAPRSTPPHCPAFPPYLARAQDGSASWVPPSCAPSTLPRTACPLPAPCGGRSGRCSHRPLRLSSVFPPCWVHASQPYCPACHPALSTLQASRNGGSSPRQTGGTTAPPALALFPHRAMPLSTAFYPPCLAHAEIIIYIMCK